MFKKFNEFINESLSKYDVLNKFSEYLNNERKGYYWIFTASTLKGDEFSGNILHPEIIGYYDKQDVIERLKDNKKDIQKKHTLLKNAIKEFNKEEGQTIYISDFKIIDNSNIVTVNNAPGGKAYESQAIYAKVRLKVK